MRLVLALIAALAVTSNFAFAHRIYDMEGAHRYSGCMCRFGYGDNGCAEVVSCSGEGGHCARACVLPARGEHSALGQ